MTLLARAWIGAARPRRRLSSDGPTDDPMDLLTEPFDPAAAYGNRWWGITPSALRGMLSASGFVVDELRLAPFLATAIARPG
jgi:hypothetical protein